VIDAAKSRSERAVKPILEIQHRWVEALVKADTAALDAILVDSYVDTGEGGCRPDKAGGPGPARVNPSHRKYFLPPPWFCKTESGEQSQRTEPPWPITELTEFAPI